MGQTVSFHETLRRLAMIDEGFVEDQSGAQACPGRGGGPGSQDRGAAASRGVGGHRVAGGLPGMERGRALAAGASEDEIAGVLLAIAPVTGLGRVAAAAPDLAIALEYDITAALEDPD